MYSKRKDEMYSIIRYVSTDVDYVVNVETVEELSLTWNESIKYAKKNYSVVKFNKRIGVIIVK